MAAVAIVTKYRLKEAKDLQHKGCFLAVSDISMYPFSPSLKRKNEQGGLLTLHMETRHSLKREHEVIKISIKISQAHLDKNVPTVADLQREVRDLRAQPRLHLFVHLVARFHQLHSQIHVVPWEPIVGPQCQGSWQEAHKVVLERDRRKEEGADGKMT